MTHATPVHVSDSELELGKKMVLLLVDVESRMPLVKAKYGSVSKLHGELVLSGFKLIKRESFKSPIAGWQLFYLRGRVLVRVKTRGAERDKDAHRRGAPHLTISLISGQHDDKGAIDTSWDAELGKFHLSGGLVNKSPAMRNVPVANSRNDEWADETHFDFPNLDFNDQDVMRLSLG
jgi:hypothetical protein